MKKVKDEEKSHQYERMVIDKLSSDILNEIIKTNKKLNTIQIKTFNLVFSEPTKQANKVNKKWWQFWTIQPGLRGVKVKSKEQV